MRVLGPARDRSTTWRAGHRFRARPLCRGRLQGPESLGVKGTFEFCCWPARSTRRAVQEPSLVQATAWPGARPGGRLRGAQPGSARLGRMSGYVVLANANAHAGSVEHEALD